MGGQSIVLSSLRRNNTIGMLKEMVCVRVGVTQQKDIWLIYKGVKLQDDKKTLAALDIGSGDSISYNLRSVGGI